MNEMNEIPENQNNEEIKEQAITTEGVDANVLSTETTKQQVQKFKLSFIIGGIVAAVALIAIILAIVFGGGSNNQGGGNASDNDDTTANGGNTVPVCTHDDPIKIVACEDKNATCQQTGLTGGMKCTVCDTIVVSQTVTPKIDCIESDWIVDKKATQDEEGKKHTECIMCHTKMQEAIITVASQGLEYKIHVDGKAYTVAGIGHCTDTDIIIPAVYNGLPVEAVGYQAFKNCKNITSVVIPDSVTGMGVGAFRGCTSLTSVVIGDSVTSIKADTFRGCSSLSSVVIGGGVTNIGDAAFSDCTSLTSVVIPDSVTYINIGTFYNCTSLTSVVIGNSIVLINDNAFYGCSSLRDVYYTGSEEEWGAIMIRSNNDYLTSATIHYNYTPQN